MSADRAEELLAQMTQAEKLAQLGSAWSFELLDGSQVRPVAVERLLGDGIGEITRIAGATTLHADEIREATDDIDRYLRKETRLGIPAIVHEECVSGYMARDAVVFPAPIGQASSWDPQLVCEIADHIRAEMVAAGARHGLAPVLDVARDPRWGRIEETFGEDAYLVSAMGVAFVKGLQGPDLRTGVLATAKHYVGHGAPAGGRNAGPHHIGPRELRDVYLRPFVAAIQAGVATVMHAYPELDGMPCLANRDLLVDVLRSELGFDGLLVSDYNGIEELVDSQAYAADIEHATELAMRSELDVELPATCAYGEPLERLVAAGRVDPAALDRACLRVLRAKLALGLLEPSPSEPTESSSVDGARLARRAAVGSMVLLQNREGLLPLAGGTIALIGPNATSGRNLLGDYAHPAHIEALAAMRGHDNAINAAVPADLDLVPDTSRLDTIAAALERVRDGDVVVARGCDVDSDDRSGFAEACAVADSADVAVLVLGERSGLVLGCTCGEARDRTDLGLPGVQQELLEAVLATGTPVVLITVGGRPLALEWAAANVGAWLHVWPPGEHGAAAVADVLVGEAEPLGRLPVTVPRHVGQVPVFYGHKPTGAGSRWLADYVDRRHEPLFAFGYGLGYTAFEVGELEVSEAEVAPGDPLDATVTVANAGSRAGSTVVQLYASQIGPRSVTRPTLELVGFERVALPPGGSATVRFGIDTRILSFTASDLRLTVEPGDVELAAGFASDHLPARGRVRLVGDPLVLDPAVVFTTSSVIA